MFCAVNKGNSDSRTLLLVLTTLSRVADSITPDDKLILIGKGLSLYWHINMQ